MKRKNLIPSIISIAVTFILTIAALAVLGFVFLSQGRTWLEGTGFMGNDTPQFIYYVVYFSRHLTFPINSWDYFWHNGIPRVIDLTWIHFSLVALLAKSVGLFAAIKIYPIIALGLGAVFAYFVFFQLSKSVLISLALAISYVISGGYYTALYGGGVVLSAISQMFLPLQLLFLIRFVQKGNYKDLVLGSVASGLGMGTHGLMMMFFGFIPSFIFVLFGNGESDALITKKTIVDAVIFGMVTMCFGAIFVWPNLLLALQGGSTTTFWQHMGYDPNNLKALFKLNDSGPAYGVVAGTVVCFIFWIFKRKPDRVIKPVVVLTIIYFFWMVSYTVGGNRLFEVLFPGRIFWIWSLLLGCLASTLVAPLSVYQANNKFSKLAKFLGFNLVKLIVFGVIIFSPLMFFNFSSLGSIRSFINKFTLPKIENGNFTIDTEKWFKDVLEVVDRNNINVRFWTHDDSINTSWIHVSNMPLSEGYAHIWTYYSRLWEGWFYGVMSAPNWISQEIPRDMAKAQSLFFIDWYGVKYLKGDNTQGEWGIASHFFENVPYIEKTKTLSDGKNSILVVADDYTSPLIEAVKVPVIGFVGNDDSYMTFLKDLAMLDLNTSHLIPVKLSQTISGVTSQKLKLVDGLIIYDFKKQGLFYSSGWNKIGNFVRDGGKIWIESGGNSGEREDASLPSIFPIKSSRYGPLDRTWQVGGEMTKEIDFSTFSPLEYKGTTWQLSYAPQGSIKDGSRVLLTQKGNPIAVSESVAKGKVVWSGANFWYRPEEYRKNGVNEGSVIGYLIKEMMGDLPSVRADAQVERKTPEKITVTGQGFSGVVVKENHWPGWVAEVTSGKKTASVPVFTAGPELMFIPVPQDLRQGQIRVQVIYKGSLFYWFCFFVSGGSLVIIVVYLVSGKIMFSKKTVEFSKKHFNSLKETLAGWWSKEEG